MSIMSTRPRNRLAGTVVLRFPAQPFDSTHPATRHDSEQHQEEPAINSIRGSVTAYGVGSGDPEAMMGARLEASLRGERDRMGDSKCWEFQRETAIRKKHAGRKGSNPVLQAFSRRGVVVGASVTGTSRQFRR